MFRGQGQKQGDFITPNVYQIGRLTINRVHYFEPLRRQCNGRIAGTEGETVEDLVGEVRELLLQLVVVVVWSEVLAEDVHGEGGVFSGSQSNPDHVSHILIRVELFLP